MKTIGCPARIVSVALTAALLGALSIGAQAQVTSRLGGALFAGNGNGGYGGALTSYGNGVASYYYPLPAQNDATVANASNGQGQAPAVAGNQSAPVAPAVVTAANPGTVTAHYNAQRRLVIQWSGDATNVARVYIALLSARGQVVRQVTVSRLPVQAALSATRTTKYYGVQVVYTDGTSNTGYWPLP